MTWLDKGSVRRLANLIKKDNAAAVSELLGPKFSFDQEMSFQPPRPTATLLDFASEKGAEKIVRFLLKAGAIPDRGKHSKPLITAVLFSRIKIVKLLLDAGADPNVTVPDPGERDDGYTALMAAAALPDGYELLDLLLKSGAEPGLATKNGRSALSQAVGRKNERAVQRLLKAGVKAAGNELFSPVYDGDVETVRRLIKAGADVNVVQRGKFGLAETSPLESAIQQRGMNFVMDRSYAKSSNSWVRSQLKRHANENKRYLEIIEEMVRAGAHLDRINVDDSPLYRAARANDLELLKLLLKAGADPNRGIRQMPWKTVYRDTALHAAAQENFGEIARALIDAGIDVSRKDRDGHTPLDYAVAKGHAPMVALLENAGAKKGAPVTDSD